MNALVSPCGLVEVAVDEGVLVKNRALGGGFIVSGFAGVFSTTSLSTIGLMFVLADGTGRVSFFWREADSSEKRRRFADFFFTVNPFFVAPVLYLVVASVTKVSSFCLAMSMRFK